MLADARAGKFGILIVDRIDRLTRAEEIGDYFAVKRELQKCNVQDVYVDQTYDDGPLGQLIKAVQAYSSGQKVYQTRIASQRGLSDRVLRDGLPLLGRFPPYGYQWVPGTTPVKIQAIKDPQGSRDAGHSRSDMALLPPR